jgi:PPK2 family polyphosphate:nucleotide phosphotransferase
VIAAVATKWNDIAHYQVPTDDSFRLKHQNPDFTGEIEGKKQAAELLQGGVEQLAELQDVLYADGRWGVLVVLQAIDAAGKDSTIKHVMSGVNPQGVRVRSFKKPSSDEMSHNWLWRYSNEVPARGEIGIFNRSYYEDVLVVKVHNLASKQGLHESLTGKKLFAHRYEDINAYEKHLTRNGIIVLKFFLHISADEQRKRFLRRLERPEKNWKFSLSDLEERRYWDDYQDAFESMMRNTSTDYAPWYCVPMNNKWFGRLVVTKTIIERLKALGLSYPQLNEAQKQALEKGREMLA